MLQKYHCYEASTDNYICTLYRLTDVLNLQLYLKEHNSDLYVQAVKMPKKEREMIFSKKVKEELLNPEDYIPMKKPSEKKSGNYRL